MATPLIYPGPKDLPLTFLLTTTVQLDPGEAEELVKHRASTDGGNQPPAQREKALPNGDAQHQRGLAWSHWPQQSNGLPLMLSCMGLHGGRIWGWICTEGKVQLRVGPDWPEGGIRYLKLFPGLISGAPGSCEPTRRVMCLSRG